MKKTWLKTVAVLLVLFLAGSTVAMAQGDVTFKVKLGPQVAKGKFVIGTNVVTIRGSFNDWGNSTNNPDTLKTYSAADTSYSLTKTIAEGAINYKFWASGTLDYESISDNRTFTVVTGAQTVPTVFFNNDSIYAAPAVKVPVTFRVNMSVRWRQGFFRPDSGDIVRVAGSMNGWGGSTDTLVKGASDSIFSKTLSLDEGSTVNYKFLKTVRNGDWESIADNRAYTVPTGGGSAPLVYFDNDSVYRAPVSGTIKWQININPMKLLGWFDPAKDTMQVRGGFEGWGGTRITQDLLNVNIYSKSIAFAGLAGDAQSYKFYMKLDSVHAVSLWGSDWADHKDDYNYEHPSEHGDGNNQYTYSVGGTITLPIAYYSGINPQGLLGANDSVMVTFRVNAGPAMRYTNPFVPATDTMKVVLFDRLWRASQKKSQHLATLPETMIMTRVSPTDSVWTVTMKVKGPTHYNIIYYYRFDKGDATSVSEGGGLGVTNPYRSRFIQKSGSVWPATYQMPVDTWKKDAPLNVESAQFTTGLPVAETPGTYELFQNYPNPFNPTTSIRFTLPAQSKVTLKVFDLLGREVATLVNGELPSGSHIAAFDASRLASGVYFYRLEAGSFTQVNKMMLLK